VLERGFPFRRLASRPLLVLPARVDEREKELLDAPPHRQRFVEPRAEEVLGDGRQEAEDLHVLGAVDEWLPQRGSDRVHRGLVQALAEAHEHEEEKHSVLERVHDARRRGVGPGLAELVDEHAARPRARRREEPHPRRVQRLGDEVAAQEAPHGTVAGAGDDVVVLAEEPALRERRAVRQRCATVDERLVRDAAVGDEDGEPRPDAERHDGAVTLEEAPQQGLGLGGRVGEPHHAAEQRQRRRARGEAAPAPRAEQEEECGGEEEEERAKEESRRVHWVGSECTGGRPAGAGTGGLLWVDGGSLRPSIYMGSNGLLFLHQQEVASKESGSHP